VFVGGFAIMAFVSKQQTYIQLLRLAKQQFCSGGILLPLVTLKEVLVSRAA